MSKLVEPHLKTLIPYVPGKPIEETEREYGVTDIAKLASNENCLGPSPKALEAMRTAAAAGHLYPDADCFYLKERLLLRHQAQDVQRGQLVVGNGTNEILTLMARAFLGEGEALLNGWPSFVIYRLAARGLGREEIAVPLTPDLQYDLPGMLQAAQAASAPVKMVYLANPNNPTGRHIGRAELDAFVEGLAPEVLLVLDEAYAEYATAPDYPDGVEWVMRRPRTVVTRTFSKVFGLAALRVGYAICDPEIADILNRLRDPFNVNAIGQQAAIAALDDTEHMERSRAHNAEHLPRLQAGLEELGVRVTPSQANFVLMHLPDGFDMADVHEGMLKSAVIIRPMKGYGLPRAARVTVGTESENQRFLDALGAQLRA